MNYITRFLFGEEEETSRRMEGVFEYTNRVGLLSSANLFTTCMAGMFVLTIRKAIEREMTMKEAAVACIASYTAALTTSHITNYIVYAKFEVPKKSNKK